MKAKGIICMANLDCMWGLVIAPPEASGCAEQQSGRRLSSSGFTVSVPTSQPWGGSENKEAEGAAGEGYTDSSFTQNISPPCIVWKIRKVNASCLIENKGSNLKPSASNTCTLSFHLSVSVSWLILKHNPFGAPTCHNISLRPPSLPHSGQFQVAAGWTGMFYFNKSDSWLRPESSLWFCLEKNIYREKEGHKEKDLL